MAKKRYYDGMREQADTMGFGADHSAPANMPQNVIHKFYPKADYGSDERLNDDMKGIDVQMRDDDKKQKSGKYPEKY